jgi:type IV secretory pathway protease TraF
VSVKLVDGALRGDDITASTCSEADLECQRQRAIGLYSVNPINAHHVSDLVVVWSPEALAAFLDTRGYLTKGILLLKHIAALLGQVVCRTGRTITINGVTMGHMLDSDHLGRILPVWEGCRVVADQEMFLMNWQSENSRLPSFADGRAASRSSGDSACTNWLRFFCSPGSASRTPNQLQGLKTALLFLRIGSWDSYSTHRSDSRFCHPGFGRLCGWRTSVILAPLSPKGAMALMQIIPDTWPELRSRYGLGADPYDPHDNIIAGDDEACRARL